MSFAVRLAVSFFKYRKKLIMLCLQQNVKVRSIDFWKEPSVVLKKVFLKVSLKNFIKKETVAQVLSYEFCEIF